MAASLGLEVESAADGQHALESVARSAAADRPFRAAAAGLEDAGHGRHRMRSSGSPSVGSSHPPPTVLMVTAFSRDEAERQLGRAPVARGGAAGQAGHAFDAARRLRQCARAAARADAASSSATSCCKAGRPRWPAHASCWSRTTASTRSSRATCSAAPASSSASPATARRRWTLLERETLRRRADGLPDAGHGRLRRHAGAAPAAARCSSCRSSR